MDMNSVRRIAWSRVLILVVVAVAAFVYSGRLTEHRNQNLPTSEASQSIAFVEEPQSLDRDDFEEFLQMQLELAEQVNNDSLDDTPGTLAPWSLSEIRLVSQENQIQFVGRGFSPEEAEERVDAMVSNYMAASQVGAGFERLNDDLVEVTQQIQTLRSRIVEAQRPTPLTDDELVSENTRITVETAIAALTDRYGELQVEVLNPVERPADEIRAEMGRVQSERLELERQLVSIPVPPSLDESTPPDEAVLLDQLRLEQMETQWETLYQAQARLSDLTQVGAVTTQPLTIEPSNLRLNQALAVVGAIVVALLAMVGIERARGVVWSEESMEDTQVPVLAEFRPRRLDWFKYPSEEPWYLATTDFARKGSIQVLRAQLARGPERVLVFQGAGAHESDIQETAADVAAALAVSGKKVLLIDAAAGRPNRLIEFGSGSELTLAKLLHDDGSDHEDTVSTFKTAFSSAEEVLTGLRAIPVGEWQDDLADALSARRFETMIEVAKEMFDFILLTGSDTEDSASYTLAQRSDAVIMVGSAGHTIREQVESTDRDFEGLKSTLMGTVLLRRRRSPVTRWFAPLFRTRLWMAIAWVRETIREYRSDDSEQE